MWVRTGCQNDPVIGSGWDEAILYREKPCKMAETCWPRDIYDGEVKRMLERERENSLPKGRWVEGACAKRSASGLCHCATVPPGVLTKRGKSTAA